MRKYEGMFIIDPQLNDEEQKKKSETIQEAIKKFSGQVDTAELLGKKKLAYRINKKREGVYCLMRFQAEPDAITKLYKACGLDESILRVMIVNAGG